MPEFPFSVTVIVPVYNVEKYIENCIESLLNQKFDFSKIEVLLINDGSTDTSEEICKKYADKYENIILFSKENEGLSKTRNYGLGKARGKYIMYLDSDDTLSNDTIKEVTEFFDSVYEKTDLVTYRITQYYNGRPTIVHYRYMTLTHTGVYDLNDGKNRFITQTNINICVKNRGEQNILFDTTPDFKHEDEKYCCDIISRKMMIGFCSKGEYIYNRENTESIVSTQFSPKIIFESSMSFYEELFAKYKTVPVYFQGIVFNDLRWKLMDEKLIPIHYEDEKLLESQGRIDALLDRMDEDTIVLHPSLNELHMNYWLSRRPSSFPTVISDSDGISVCSDGRRIYHEHKIKARIISRSNTEFKAMLISPMFFHIKKERYYVEYVIDGKCTSSDDFEFGCSGSELCYPISEYLPSFKFNCNIDKITDLVFVLDGNRFKIVF